jgi:hypothetical protein
MKNRKWPKVIKFLLLLVIFVGFFTGALLLYEDATGDFRKSNIVHDLPYNDKWDFTSDQAEKDWLNSVLSQKFTWLGQGRQTFAFVSEDQRYVLKIFKFQKIKPNTLSVLSKLPFLSKYYENQENLRQIRFDRLFEGYRVANCFDRDNCGLHYVHLNRSSNLKKWVALTDRLGFKHDIDMDTVIFAIQDKGRMTKEVLAELLNKNDLIQAKMRIAQILELYVSEYKKGVVDMDHGVLHNTGFVENRAIRLDLGQIKLDESFKSVKVFKRDLIKIVSKRLNSWLIKRYPEAQPELQGYMEQRLSEILGEPIKFQK